MRYLYAALQFCSAALLSLALILALAGLSGRQDDITALPAFSAGGLGIAQWNSKTADMVYFEAQSAFSWKPYDFEAGRKVPVFPDGSFAKDPFVNPSRNDVGYFVSEKDARNAEMLNSWLESLCARLEGMELAGVSADMGCAFMRDAANSSTHWAARKRPLSFNVPEAVLKVLKEADSVHVRKEKFLIPLTDVGEDMAEFFVPVLKRTVTKTREKRGAGAGRIICEPYGPENPAK